MNYSKLLKMLIIGIIKLVKIIVFPEPEPSLTGPAYIQHDTRLVNLIKQAAFGIMLELMVIYFRK